jgi:hypothetical protein
MDRSKAWSAWMLSALIAVALPTAAEAQDWFVDWAFEKSFTSTEPYRSPDGFTVGIGGMALWGPLGLEATYRSLSSASRAVPQDCAGAPASCVPGSLRMSYRMRTAGLGVSYDFVNPTDVVLTVTVAGTKNWHREHARHLDTGERFGNDLASSLGFSTSAHLRLRPILSGLRPELTVRYDRSGSGHCSTEPACVTGQSAFGVSVGFGWVLRPPRRD